MKVILLPRHSVNQQAEIKTVSDAELKAFMQIDVAENLKKSVKKIHGRYVNAGRTSDEFDFYYNGDVMGLASLDNYNMNLGKYLRVSGSDFDQTAGNVFVTRKNWKDVRDGDLEIIKDGDDPSTSIDSLFKKKAPRKPRKPRKAKKPVQPTQDANKDKKTRAAVGRKRVAEVPLGESVESKRAVTIGDIRCFFDAKRQ